MTTDSKFSRRDFLKLLALTPAALAAQPLLSLPAKRLDSTTPNVLIFVFDAWAASNVQFYGYPRLTMPSLGRFAERAFVYHNHYSAGCFTVPGTGSLLTSLHPWTHRAFQLTAAEVSKVSTAPSDSTSRTRGPCRKLSLMTLRALTAFWALARQLEAA